MLLGETFLIHNEEIINYKNGTIRINDKTLYLTEVIEEWYDNPDARLVEKAFFIKEDLEKR